MLIRSHPHAQPLTRITRCIGGSWLTRFYGLWLQRRENGWSLWLGCPHSKIVHLIRLLQHHPQRYEKPATVIPLHGWHARHGRISTPHSGQ